MFKYCALVSTLWFFLRVNPDFEASYNLISGYVTVHQTALCIWTVICSICFLGLTYLFDMLGCHSLMWFIANLIFEISQSAICIVTLGAALVYLDLGIVMWESLGYAAILPLLTLATSLCCFRLFDFNYPIRSNLFSSMVLPLLSVIFFGYILSSGD